MGLGIRGRRRAMGIAGQIEKIAAERCYTFPGSYYLPNDTRDLPFVAPRSALAFTTTVDFSRVRILRNATLFTEGHFRRDRERIIFQTRFRGRLMLEKDFKIKWVSTICLSSCSPFGSTRREFHPMRFAFLRWRVSHARSWVEEATACCSLIERLT